MHKKIVVIGAGIGGLLAAKQLNATLITQEQEFTFYPLLPDSISQEVTATLPVKKCHKNVLFAEVQKINLETNTVHTNKQTITYDYLIVATGARAATFIPGTSKYAKSLYTLEEAKEVRKLTNKEIIVIGGGPTGVEVACELAKNNQVTILHRPKHLLKGFSQQTYLYANKQLSKYSVTIHTDITAQKITKNYVYTDKKRFSYDEVICAAGVQANILQGLPAEKGILVNKHLQIQGSTNAFAIGDCAQTNNPLTAQVAMYEARLAAKNICLLQQNKPLQTNQFVCKGSMLGLGETAVLESRLSLRGKLAFWMRKTYYWLRVRSYRL
ncbi:MAG: NAD(P)/FAD-dependent oxidoreductase [Candidatus Woesearchaeota archaeon]